MGLTTPSIAERNGRTTPGIFIALRRLKVQPLKFQGKRLYSVAQADFLLSHMRKPIDRASSKKRGACPAR